MTDLERFMALVLPEPNSGCWLWIGATHRQGYGHFALNRKTVLAHRASWKLHYGKMPRPNTQVCHRCDVPACVNPDHLWLGTMQQNNADKMQKGRHGFYAGIGSQNSMSILSENAVRYILRSSLTGRALAREYEVAESTIGMIRRGKNWRHLYEEWQSENATKRAEMRL